TAEEGTFDVNAIVTAGVNDTYTIHVVYYAVVALDPYHGVVTLEAIPPITTTTRTATIVTGSKAGISFSHSRALYASGAGQDVEPGRGQRLRSAVYGSRRDAHEQSGRQHDRAGRRSAVDGISRRSQRVSRLSRIHRSAGDVEVLPESIRRRRIDVRTGGGCRGWRQYDRQHRRRSARRHGVLLPPRPGRRRQQGSARRSRPSG